MKLHYYPEGGWGWVILFCASVSQCVTYGLTLAAGTLLANLGRRHGASSDMANIRNPSVSSNNFILGRYRFALSPISGVNHIPARTPTPLAGLIASASFPIDDSSNCSVHSTCPYSLIHPMQICLSRQSCIASTDNPFSFYIHFNGYMVTWSVTNPEFETFNLFLDISMSILCWWSICKVEAQLLIDLWSHLLRLQLHCLRAIGCLLSNCLSFYLINTQCGFNQIVMVVIVSLRGLELSLNGRLTFTSFLVKAIESNILRNRVVIKKLQALNFNWA